MSLHHIAHPGSPTACIAHILGYLRPKPDPGSDSILFNPKMNSQKNRNSPIEIRIKKIIHVILPSVNPLSRCWGLPCFVPASRPGHVNMFNFKQLNSYLKRLQALGDGLTPARPPAPVYRQAESGKPLVR
jgi:hypothetical protein